MKPRCHRRTLPVFNMSQNPDLEGSPCSIAGVTAFGRAEAVAFSLAYHSGVSVFSLASELWEVTGLHKWFVHGHCLKVAQPETELDQAPDWGQEYWDC